VWVLEFTISCTCSSSIDCKIHRTTARQQLYSSSLSHANPITNILSFSPVTISWVSLACNIWNFHQEKFSPLNSSLQIHPSTQELQTSSPLSYVRVWTSLKKWLPLTPVTWAWCRTSVLNISFLFWYSSCYQIKESQDHKLNISLNCSYLCYYFGFHQQWWYNEKLHLKFPLTKPLVTKVQLVEFTKPIGTQKLHNLGIFQRSSFQCLETWNGFNQAGDGSCYSFSIISSNKSAVWMVHIWEMLMQKMLHTIANWKLHIHWNRARIKGESGWIIPVSSSSNTMRKARR